ncbi:MAG TPA: phosphate regulon transcriptional regulatory protein PhoB [Thiotrichales bacterium]|nr:phosphate regulon transcriptional regulatory protein PhoB [Thiotrichales bacterium]
MEKILIVEDDEAIQDMLQFALESEDYRLYQATNVKDAWAVIDSKALDLVLLDWMLPDSSGIDLLHRIRKHHSRLPVIMITARIDEEDRVRGLDTGADDYITKPFSVKELKSRIRAVLRRSRPDAQAVQAGAIFLDPSSQRVTVNDKALELSPTEFRLLHYFMTHAERVFSRAQLLDQVWGEQVYVEERTVDVHIRRLRKALEPCGLDTMVQTVHGRGYRFSRQS